jgi:hypothetical protein
MGLLLRSSLFKPALLKLENRPFETSSSVPSDPGLGECGDRRMEKHEQHFKSLSGRLPCFQRQADRRSVDFASE